MQVYATWVGAQEDQRYHMLGAGVTRDCEPSDVSSRIQTLEE